MAGERLVEVMKRAARSGIPQTERTDLVWGTVTEADPIKITLDNDPKLILDETFLFLSPLCKEKRFTIPEWKTDDETQHVHAITVNVHTTVTEGSATSTATASCAPTTHKHTIPEHPDVLVWRGLEAGDRVLMLRCAMGALYYVLQREGDL